MTSIFDDFPSKYLKASDLEGRTLPVVMDRIERENIGDDYKPVIYFRGQQKGLVLNRTNANTIVEMHGEDPRNWPGKEIAIFPTRVDFKGKRTDAIRVQFVQPQPSNMTPHNPQTGEVIESDALRIHDEALAAAAARGVTALKVAWTLVPRELQPSLKAALDRRHKPAAEQADLAGAMNDEVPF